MEKKYLSRYFIKGVDDMQKNNLCKTATIGFLASFIATLYVTKFKSIMLGVSGQSYLIYISTLIICGVLVYGNEEFKSWLKIVLKQKINTKNIPDIVYNFCKKYYMCTDKEAVGFVKENVKDKELANFFARFLDKNNYQEISDYLDIQYNIFKDNELKIRKVVNYNNIFLLFAIATSYVYDSNIKGIILISGILSIFNLLTSKKIDSYINNQRLMISLYKNISQDILKFKNPKYIMYKCENILMLTEDEITIEKLVVADEKPIVRTITNRVNNLDVSIESRKSKLITIGAKNTINNIEEDKKISC